MPSDDTKYVNAPAPGIPYFTPAQIPPAGTAVDPQPTCKPIPKLFTPLKIRGLEVHNRIWLAPLCQYSAKDGVPTAWHFAHLGGIISRGPGLSLVEATGVTPEGRITPGCLGLWNDEQAAAFSDIVTFAHSQNQKIGIQLAHSGRKGSMVAPWLSFNGKATEVLDGWPDDVVAPSAVAYSPAYYEPKALTKEGVQRIKIAFVEAAKRAVRVGFDLIEIHSAHGYLLHEFLSPVANKRTDEYGGSFENRTRLHVEIVDAIRAVISQDMPLFIRISGSDLLETTLLNEPSWTVEDSTRFSILVAEHGVDLIDVSAGGIHPSQDLVLAAKTRTGAYQAHLAAHIRKAVQDKVLIASVGGITSGRVAEEVLQSGSAAVFVGRHLTKNPGAVWQFAEELDTLIYVPNQIEWGFLGRGVGSKRTPAAKL